MVYNVKLGLSSAKLSPHSRKVILMLFGPYLGFFGRWGLAQKHFLVSIDIDFYTPLFPPSSADPNIGRNLLTIIRLIPRMAHIV